MATLQIDLESPGPLHAAVAAAVRRAVAEGELAGGDSLPPARQLADTLGVNVNTVLRGYRELRDEGLIDLRRGRGATVLASTAGRARLHGLLDALLAEGAHQGLGADDLHQLLKERT